MNKITSRDYDALVLAQGLQFQIDNYYEPKEVSMKERVSIVMAALQPKQGEWILDVGCGVGTFAFHCIKAGVLAVGLDYSFESIRTAKRLCEKFGVSPWARFVVASAANLPFKDGSFDKLVAADFIEHITLPEKERFVKEMRRALKAKGSAVIFTPNRTRERIGAFYWKLRNKLFKNSIPTTDLHFGLTGEAEFKKICRKNNFRINLRFKDITRPCLARLPVLRRFLALNLLWRLGCEHECVDKNTSFEL